MTVIVHVEEMVCRDCRRRLHDRCRGRCLCAHDDPVIMAAQSLATTIAYIRDLVTDPAFADLVPSFARIAAALPGVEIPVPAPRSG